MINVQNIQKRVSAINEAYAGGDFIAGHNKTEDLFADVLEAIRDGHTDPKTIAAAALEAND